MRAVGRGSAAWRSALGVGGLVLLLTGGSSLFGGSARAAEQQDLPRQMFFFGMPLDPLDQEGPWPLRAGLRVLELPDGRDAQILRIGGWTRVGGSNAARWSLDYVGIENDEVFRYGGGRTTLGWTSRFGGVSRRSVALDLDGNLPTGDTGLYPLSARAPAIRLRVRASLIYRPRWQLWTGVWTQRVSPPSGEHRDRPLAAFVSGSGYELHLRWSTPRLDGKLSASFDRAGVPDSQWWEFETDLPLSRDLAVRVGAYLGVGARGNRRADHGWSIGLSWRPSPLKGDSPTAGGNSRPASSGAGR